MTNDWSVSRHMTPCKKRYRLEAREFVLITKYIMYTNRTCLRCLLPFKMADNRFAIIVTGDDLDALLEGVDASSTKTCTKQL